jgi:hypothetical protein
MKLTRLQTTCLWCCLIAAGALGCSSAMHLNPNATTIPGDELTQNSPEYLEAFQNEGAVVVFEKGDSLPLLIAAATPFATVETGENVLTFNQKTYLYISQEGVYISKDGDTYVELYDMEAIKKMYGAKQGQLTIGLSISEEKGAALLISTALQ